MDADVIIVGAGPTGLMLACELGLAGVRPLVLERQPRLREAPKANGFSGQIVELLRYRGLLDRVEAASNAPVHPAPADPVRRHGSGPRAPGRRPPLRVLGLPQPRLERLLARTRPRTRRRDPARTRGGRGQPGRRHGDRRTCAARTGPDQISARYLVGCDGAHSRVRDSAGIPFPGTTYPEVNRLGQATVPDSVTRLDNGDLDVPGLGRVQRGLHPDRPRRVRASGGWTSGSLMIQTTEDEPAESDDDTPMTLTEFQDSIRRVLGGELPLEEVTPAVALRVCRPGRPIGTATGRILLAGDAAHQFPATGIGINVGMLDAVNLAWKLAAEIQGWAPAGPAGHLSRRAPLRRRAGRCCRPRPRWRCGADRTQPPRRCGNSSPNWSADEQPLRRLAALIAGTDIRYPMPGPGHDPLTGTFAPDLTLRTDQGTTSVAELMPAARPVFLDLAGRPELRETARDWRHRVDIRTATTDQRAGRRPADPPGRLHRLGRHHRRTRQHRRPRPARSARPLVRQIGADDVNPLTTSAFDLPDRLAAKADPALIADDERHFAAIAESLEQIDRRPVRPPRRRAQGAGRHRPGGAGPRPGGPPADRPAARPAPLRPGPVPRAAWSRADDAEPVYVGRLGLTDSDGPPAAARLALPRGRAVLRRDPRQPDGPGQPPPVPLDPRPDQRLLGRGVHRRTGSTGTRRARRPVRLHRQPGQQPVAPDARRARHHPGRPGRHHPRRVARRARRRRRPGHRARPSSRCTAPPTCSTPTRASATAAAACCSSARTSPTWPTSPTCCPASARRACRPARCATSSPRAPRPRPRPTRTWPG